MKRRILILLCCTLLGATAAGCMMMTEIYGGEAGAQAPAGRSMAWWSLTCEVPNPERLPVQVRFQWLKGLE